MMLVVVYTERRLISTWELFLVLRGKLFHEKVTVPQESPPSTHPGPEAFHKYTNQIISA